MKKITYLVLSVFFSITLFCCISDFSPHGIVGLSDLLVVEGFITQDESTFKVSRSLDLSDESSYYPPVTNIRNMYIECNDGTQIGPTTSVTPGEYRIATGSLDPNKQYRLFFELNGEEYASDFLTPLITPEIDSISYIKKASGQPIQICVNATEEKDQSRYFYWSYVEDWEVWAPMEAEYGKNANGEVYKFVPPENTYYCWGNDASMGLFLGSTANLSTNKIVNHKLLEISPTSDKLSVIYHIEISQNLLRKEAYDYFYNLQKNIDQNSGLFTSMPTEIKGNIRNLTTPDIPIIGYIEVSTTAKSTRFIDYSEGLYEYPSSYYSILVSCDTTETRNSEDAARWNYWPYINDMGIIYKPRECVDCRVKYKATKNKPDFWPGDRQ